MTELTQNLVRQNLDDALERTDFSWGQKHEGKVRDNYVLPDGRRVMIATDRLSAFDRYVGSVPLRGQVLTQSSLWWFNRTRDIVDNHCLGLLDPSALLVEDCTPLPVEMVVRGYVTGCTSTSIWMHYERGVREFCGHRLPDHLRKHERLKSPILTPSTKAPKGKHDESVSKSVILAQTGVSSADFDACADLALALFNRGTQLCERQGVILVDTKYEFGKTADGKIILIDEIHTPDCSRFWDAHEYARALHAGGDPENFDKEFARIALNRRAPGSDIALSDDLRILVGERYIDIVERIQETPLLLSSGAPVSRLERSYESWRRAPASPMWRPEPESAGDAQRAGVSA
jgi:phosphoribosylaminoimidazole-succinocarboxamide synthase